MVDGAARLFPGLEPAAFPLLFSLGVAEKHFISSTNTNHKQIPSKVESTASLDLNTYLLQIKTLGLGFIKGVFSDIC